MISLRWEYGAWVMLGNLRGDSRLAAVRAAAVIEGDPQVARPDQGGTRLYETESVFVAYRLDESGPLIVAVFARQD